MFVPSKVSRQRSRPTGRGIRQFINSWWDGKRGFFDTTRFHFSDGQLLKIFLASFAVEAFTAKDAKEFRKGR
jgi:hypothetical protein